jgi:hypothetical protein
VRDLSSGLISVKVLQTCMDSLKSGPVSLSETCQRSSVDGSEAVGIKVVETTERASRGNNISNSKD